MPSRLLRRVLLILGLLSVTLMTGTLGYKLIEPYTWFESFYLALTTVTTANNQQPRALSHAGLVFSSFLILFGVTAMFLSVGAITQTIIELELHDLYGKRRRRRMIDQLHDHYIVCGFGRVGRNAAFEFQRANAPFLVLDHRDERISRATASGMVATVADATQDDSLRAAGVLRARGLISALPSDAENLFIILSAKALNPKLTVATRASDEEAGQKLRRAGADTVLTPYTMAGRQLADALLRPKVVEFLDFARDKMGGTITIEQVAIAGPTNNGRKTLGQLTELRNFGVIVLAIRRRDGETLFNPPEDASLASGDFLIIMGERSRLQSLERVLIC